MGPGAVVPVVGAMVGGGAYAMMAMNCIDNGGCLKVSQGNMLGISTETFKKCRALRTKFPLVCFLLVNLLV